MKLFVGCLLILSVSFKVGDSREMQHTQPKDGIDIEVQNEVEPGKNQVKFISLEMIKNLVVDSAKTGDDSDNPNRTWLGTNLCRLFEEELHIACNDIVKLSISAPDGYMSVISGEMLSALNSGIFAYGIKGDLKWHKKYGKVRLIFPGLRPMYWVNKPDKILITMGQKKKQTHQYLFYYLDSRQMNSIIRKDVTDRRYIAIDDILVNLNYPHHPFSVLTQDGVFREYSNNTINRRLLLHQEDTATWKLTGVNVPAGLKLRKIFFMTIQNMGLFLKSLSNEEQATWYANYFRTVMNKFQGLSNISIEITLTNDERFQTTFNHGDWHLIIEFMEQQKTQYQDFDHVIMTFED